MQTANIYIQGVIGQDTSIIDVIRQVESQEAEQYNVYITSPGGLIDEGFAIYNYLKNLKAKVNTYARGNCDSIATVIFQAGAKRYIDENINSFVIHNAHINPSFLGSSVDANALKRVEEELRKQEDKITSFYTENTKLSFSTLDSLMDKESNLEANDAVTLGFADATFNDIKAAALLLTSENIDSNNKTDNNMAEANVLQKMWDWIVRKSSQNIFFLKLSDGQELYVDSEDGDFIGKMAYLVEGGEITSTPSPSGTHELLTGKSIVVEDGRILELLNGEIEDEVKSMEGDKENMDEEKEDYSNMTEEEMEEKMEALMDAKFKDLENKLTQMMTKQSEDFAEARRTELDNEYKELKGMMRNITSSFNIPATNATHKTAAPNDDLLSNPSTENLRRLRAQMRANKA